MIAIMISIRFVIENLLALTPLRYHMSDIMNKSLLAELGLLQAGQLSRQFP